MRLLNRPPYPRVRSAAIAFERPSPLEISLMKSKWLPLALSTSLLAFPALAQEVPGLAEEPAQAETEKPAELSAEEKAGVALTEKYLAAVKAKKWNDAKKLLHPRTLESIAERKKRLGKEDHPMAPWFHAKEDYWLKDFKVTGARSGPEGTVIVETREDNFQVEEKGISEGDMGSYLVAAKDGKLFMVDKKRGQTFTDDSIKYGYKGWFEAPAKKAD